MGEEKSIRPAKMRQHPRPGHGSYQFHPFFEPCCRLCGSIDGADHSDDGLASQRMCGSKYVRRSLAQPDRTGKEDTQRTAMIAAWGQLEAGIDAIRDDDAAIDRSATLGDPVA